MTVVDKTKPVYRVRGRLPPPDGRRMTVFVNAETADEAERLGTAEGIATMETVELVKPEKIAEWEALYPEAGRS